MREDVEKKIEFKTNNIDRNQNSEDSLQHIPMNSESMMKIVKDEIMQTNKNFFRSRSIKPQSEISLSLPIIYEDEGLTINDIYNSPLPKIKNSNTNILSNSKTYL